MQKLCPHISNYPLNKWHHPFENQHNLSQGFRVAGRWLSRHFLPHLCSSLVFIIMVNSTTNDPQLLSFHHSPHPTQEKSLLNFPTISSLSSPSHGCHSVQPPIIPFLIYSKKPLVSLFQPIIYSPSSNQSNPLK